VALKGERFDANASWPAARAGASRRCGPLARTPAASCRPARHRGGRHPPALGALASGWRTQFTLPLIAVTGSNGKTTVTQMMASILRAWKGDAALATQGNFNNDIGVPLTLLRLRASTGGRWWNWA
jgi:UDP-N-acetylmuramoyl-tripeptide--D-alanyl-D-alanine ligase